MLKKKLKKLKVILSIIVFNLFLTCKAVSASFTLNKRGHIIYSIIETLYKMALRNFERLELYFFINASNYYNSPECYSNYYVM